MLACGGYVQAALVTENKIFHPPRPASNLPTAKSSLLTPGKEIRVTRAETLNDITVDRPLRILPGGSITVNSGKTLTINGPFKGSDLAQVFYGPGSVVFGPKATTVISPAWFGVIADTGADLGPNISMLNKCIRGTRGARVIFPKGVYKTSVPYTVCGNGVVTIGIGKVIIEPPDGGNNYSLLVGNREAGPFTESIRLTVDMTKGSNSATVTNSAGYNVGDVVYMFSGVSINSSGNNIIPLYKQFFTIAAINGNTLTFATQAEYDFMTAADAKIMSPTATPAVGGRIENIHFRNNSTFTGPYLHAILYAFNFEIANCRLDGYSAAGYVSFSDQIIYRNTVFGGYNGFSTAAGTKRVTFEGCTYKPGPVAQGIGAFIEETPESVIINNCTIHGQVRIVSSSDAYPPKQFIMRNSRIISPTKAMTIVGWYNSGSYGIDIDRCVFDAPGELNANGRKTVIDARFFNSIRITNSEFKNIAADSYVLDGGNFGTVSSNLMGNKYGTSLGIQLGITKSSNPTMQRKR